MAPDSSTPQRPQRTDRVRAGDGRVAGVGDKVGPGAGAARSPSFLDAGGQEGFKGARPLLVPWGSLRPVEEKPRDGRRGISNERSEKETRVASVSPFSPRPVLLPLPFESPGGQSGAPGPHAVQSSLLFGRASTPLDPVVSSRSCRLHLPLRAAVPLYVRIRPRSRAHCFI